jgi:Protein of unknown function (DUF2917)
MQQETPMPAPLDTPIYLKERESLRLADGAGLEVRCLLGNLWITEEGDGEDRIIANGASFVLDRPGLSLATALSGPALVVVQPGRVSAPDPLRRAA